MSELGEADHIDDKEAERVVETVRAGTDGIEVPQPLVEETKQVEKSLLMRLRTMTVSQRIKLALLGNREARMLLLRDANRLVRRLVLQNPRITDDEIIMLAKNRTTDDEFLRIIGDNRNWSKNYQVRYSLVTNPKTPLAIAVRFLGSLQERDVRALAKSKNVSATISGAAKRLILNRDTGRGGE
jgi:hypothetical protein